MPPEFNIERPKQVIVEGVDDVRVMESLCNHLGIDDIQLVPCGGYNSLRQFLRTFSADPDFRQVRSLAVIVDADENPQGRRQGVADALASAGLPRPEQLLKPISDSGLTVAYLIVPHDPPGTMMEDVCLNSVADDPVMECVEQYLECVDLANAHSPRQVWMSKARVHVFLASQDRPDLRLGEAAERGIWKFESEAFRPLSDLLRML